jgi:two-component system response regulator HydG
LAGEEFYACRRPEHPPASSVRWREWFIDFAGQRALLLDAVTMGLLRRTLVHNFGVAAARSVLTQLGFAHGWRMAEAMKAQFNWESEEEWLLA